MGEREDGLREDAVALTDWEGSLGGGYCAATSWEGRWGARGRLLVRWWRLGWKQELEREESIADERWRE